MVTLVLFGRRPSHLSAEEGDAWIRSEAGGLAALPGVRAARFTALNDASAHWIKPCEWLIELELEDAVRSEELVSQPAFAAVLADFRRLRMHPTMALASAEATVDLTASA